MTDFIYCGTNAQVDEKKTQALLINQQAIWCPPPGFRPWPEPYPQGGDRLWLVWRKKEGSPVLLLGGGRLLYPYQSLCETPILWTDKNKPGLIEEAQRLGYGGPPNPKDMCFLCLNPVHFLPGYEIRPIKGLNGIESGLNPDPLERILAI